MKGLCIGLVRIERKNGFRSQSSQTLCNSCELESCERFIPDYRYVGYTVDVGFGRSAAEADESRHHGAMKRDQWWLQWGVATGCCRLSTGRRTKFNRDRLPRCASTLIDSLDTRLLISTWCLPASSTCQLAVVGKLSSSRPSYAPNRRGLLQHTIDSKVVIAKVKARYDLQLSIR